jgi:hypothetical protein
MSDLRDIIRIKAMAEAAATALPPHPRDAQSDEVAATFVRLRAQALALHKRAGWGDEDAFALEIPVLAGYPAPIQRGDRARVLLGQLAAWAAGYQEAFEVEEQMKANAAARAAAAALAAQESARRTGFG